MTSPPLVLEDADRIASDLEGAGRARLYRVVLFVFSIGIPTDVMLSSRLGSSSLILGAPLAAAVAWQLVTTGRFRPFTAPLLSLSAFVAWAALSIFWAARPEWVVKSVTTYVQLLAFVGLAWQLLRSEEDVRAMLLGFLAGCGVLVTGAWQSYLAGESFTGDVWEGGARYVARGIDPNDMGVTLTLGIPIAAYLITSSERRARYLLLAYLPLAASGIALSGSRGAAVASAVAVAGMLWASRRRGIALALTLAGLIGGVMFAWSYVPWDSWARLFTLREQLSYGTMGDRATIWQAGWGVVTEHPFAGVGSGGFAVAVVPALGLAIAAHNTPISIAAELGAVGLLLFYGAHAFALRSAIRAPNHLVLAVTLFLTWFVGAASLSWTNRKATWFVVLVAAAVGAIRDARGEARG